MTVPNLRAKLRLIFFRDLTARDDHHQLQGREAIEEEQTGMNLTV
jgi:hypothetical protein